MYGFKRSPLHATLPVALLLIAGCAKTAQIGLESPGRPEITWHSDDTVSEANRSVTEKDTEQTLLAELHDSEQKGHNDLALANTLYSLAILRRQQGNLFEAAQLYRRALEIREREEGANHPEVATTLNNLAAAEAMQGHYDAAQPLLARALAIRRTTLGNQDALTAESLNNLALLYAAHGDAAAAEPLYQEAISIMEKASPPQTDSLRRVLNNYAALLHDVGRNAEGDAIETRAEALHAIDRPLPSPLR